MDKRQHQITEAVICAAKTGKPFEMKNLQGPLMRSERNVKARIEANNRLIDKGKTYASNIRVGAST